MIFFPLTRGTSEGAKLMSDNSMTGQVAIVTGAARGFGLAISER